MRNFLKTTLFIVFIVTFLAFLFSLVPQKEPFKPITVDKRDVEGVSVSAEIELQSIAFKVYPEKRIPKTGNWDTIVDFEVRNQKTNEKYFAENTTTNNWGLGLLNLPPRNKIPSSNNKVVVKGISHLSKVYNKIPFLRMYESYDFTVFGDLLAGDTHPSADDFINSLDISTLINKLNTSNYINDLNGDSLVNSLDLSIQVYNISRAGEKS
ncbi:MAG: hypothetical protein ABIE03_04320 [Patescibacteria group bacterium]|nr:hypothetical protein [Patescibacteria group bacterium]